MNNGNNFEDYIHYVYKTILNLKGDKVQVSKRSTFKLASGETYEVDIYYEFMRAGVRHRVAIECKDWSSPIDQGRVLEFHQKIKNIGEDIVGVIVSRSGYQSGASKIAKRHGILTLTGADIPCLGQIMAASITNALLPEPGCIGEPFWYIAEIERGSSEGTGTYYALPSGAPAKIPLFISKLHAESYWKLIPDKHDYAVFGMPQYKLRSLVGLGYLHKLTFGIIVTPPRSNGEVPMTVVDAKGLHEQYLHLPVPDQWSTSFR